MGININKRHLLIYAVTAVLCFVFWSNYAIADVQGDSMQPTMDSCDIVLLDKDAKPQEGDIIGFEQHGKKIMHRVVADATHRDPPFYSTQGDNNNTPDPPTRPSEVYGVVEYHIETPDCSQYF